MSSQDFSSDFHISDSGSRLLSESLISGSSSRTGHGGDDLSLSELSLQDRPLDPPRRKFSLFAQPPSPQDADESAIVDANDEEDVFGGEALNGSMKPEDIEKAQRAAAKTREERLQHDLLTLKKINAAFDVYKEAMRETQSNTDRVAEKLANTNALLDKYVTILAKSEKVTQLILDERWEGADADEAQIEHEIRLEQERRLQEEREREEVAQRERERLQREEEERLAKEERQRLEKEKEGSRSTSRGSGVRGVRGTRASMRGVKGSTASSRGASTTARNTPPSASTSIPTRRTGTTSTARGTSRTSSVRK